MTSWDSRLEYLQHQYGPVRGAEMYDREWLLSLTDRDEIATFIAERWADSADLLDEQVHDIKGDEAANINNAGVEAQVRYLLDAGVSTARIVDDLYGDMPR